MPVMSTCLARLGSRYSIVFDPFNRNVQYGALGLMRQSEAELVVALDDGAGGVVALPLCKEGKKFTILDQYQTMTSIVWEGYSLELGVKLTATMVAPFWPQDHKTSLVPAYVVTFRLEHMDRVRWTNCPATLGRKGVLRFGVRLPEAVTTEQGGRVQLEYGVHVGTEIKTGEGGAERDYSPTSRRVPVAGKSVDQIVPIAGDWAVRNGMLEAAYDLNDTKTLDVSAALVGYCGDELFERLGKPMRMKYAAMWSSADEVADFVVKNAKKLCEKSAKFDALWTDSSLPLSVQELSATSFQSYLMCTLWCVGERPKEWFSVWEGSCWFNSTVDVTYNEAMFYFACWPELLELVFEEWIHHTDPAEAGRTLHHDMGAGWSANGQSYPHLMPVEENSNWLLLLYAHGAWWDRPELFKKYVAFNRDMVDYLLWSDSTGNGFPDRGTANTIDDATPAVQYGRDNVYLGIKRLGALHAASRMFEAAGDKAYAAVCAKAVAKAVRTLNAGWLGDHWGVCLDKSAKGLIDCWTHKPLPYKTLPGWDAYSLYTTNGLLPLMMVDDLPPGLPADRLRQDVLNACRESMTRYGCAHSSMDTTHMWVSMNVWRDCAAGYLGEDMLANSERYWAQQLFANGPGAEKPNCFTETSLTNNLVWYPRNTAIFALTMSMPRLRINRAKKQAVTIDPIAPGRWPLLPLADWKKGTIPVAEVTRAGKVLKTKVQKASKGRPR